LARIDEIFKMVKDQGASDLHISTGAPPMLRVQGEIHTVDSPELNGEQARELFYEMRHAGRRSPPGGRRCEVAFPLGMP